MTQDNLLKDDPDQITIDESKNYLDELVGEGKKFKDAEALAKSKAYADAHIAILERRFDELKTDYVKQRDSGVAEAKLQQLLDKLETAQQQLASREQNQNSNEDNKSSLKLDEVESLIDSRMTQRERARQEEANYNSVKAKLTERYGASYKAVLKEQADSLGLTDEDVNRMARGNPNLFAKTFDLNTRAQGEQFQSVPRSSINTFTPKSPEKRTWSYYMKMKEKDPNAWLDRKTAIQMEKDSQALGKEFFDA